MKEIPLYLQLEMTSWASLGTVLTMLDNANRITKAITIQVMKRTTGIKYSAFDHIYMYLAQYKYFIIIIIIIIIVLIKDVPSINDRLGIKSEWGQGRIM